MSPSSSLLQLSFLFSLFLWLGCAIAATPPVPVGNISRVEDAEYFNIYYGHTFKVIKNGVDGMSYLLIQNTSRMATKTKYCTPRIKSFVVPLANYSVDTTYFPVSFFELLGMVGSMKGITSDSITSECVLQWYQSGEIELVNKTDPKQLTQFSAHFIGTTEGQQACNFATFLPSEEDTPLQRAEWIKYLGTFGNLETRANEVFDAVKTNYLCLSRAAANKTTSFKPVVAWLLYSEGMWSFVKEEYKMKYVVDAGGESLDDSISKSIYNVSIPDDLDNFHAILCTIDVVIDETYAPEPTAYTISTFLDNTKAQDNSSFPFLTNGRFWRYDKRIHDAAPLDWFDGGISQPQLVLADLIEAFFPSGNYNTTYFRNLGKEEGVISIVPDKCGRDSSTPMDPVIVPCQ
ncbi:hypothetical protein CKAN_01961300 [Cinnamomum micranthum f. kanehirae]|uniref:Uncharacterized protein n=1 Tax=Cinnamomum micranthum f. kanehirae TaxID=337451 RepID=A0A443PIC9_9MAGN|nr:hypothetical protein CKAN_01961300 [Cinnamomum micranthum f. kanehirae]